MTTPWQPDEQPVRVYVGTDRSQLLAVKVLEYSIKRHTDLKVEVLPMHEVAAALPEPQDPRLRSRTGFSFARFAIPELAGYTGRAIYMDADMLVFKDIRSLWNLPFEGAKIVLQEPLPEGYRSGQIKAGHTRIKQTAVMLLDCAALTWHAPSIIEGLTRGEYSYDQLLKEMCILREDEIRYALPLQWNSMEHYDASTCLIHYTDMQTQPWVQAGNPFGQLWFDEVRRMLADGSLEADAVREEVRLGHFRPSLLIELGLDPAYPNYQAGDISALELEQIDHKAGYQKHRAVFAKMREREEAAIRYALAHSQNLPERLRLMMQQAKLRLRQWARNALPGPFKLWVRQYVR